MLKPCSVSVVPCKDGCFEAVFGGWSVQSLGQAGLCCGTTCVLWYSFRSCKWIILQRSHGTSLIIWCFSNCSLVVRPPYSSFPPPMLPVFDAKCEISCIDASCNSSNSLAFYDSKLQMYNIGAKPLQHVLFLSRFRFSKLWVKVLAVTPFAARVIVWCIHYSKKELKILAAKLSVPRSITGIPLIEATSDYSCSVWHLLYFFSFFGALILRSSNRGFDWLRERRPGDFRSSTKEHNGIWSENVTSQPAPRLGYSRRDISLWVSSSDATSWSQELRVPTSFNLAGVWWRLVLVST